MRAAKMFRLATRMGPSALAAACLALLAGPAHAADSPAAACLAASAASLKSDNEHRLRDERVELLACAAASCPGDIRNECIRRVDEVNLALPTIIFEAKDEVGNDLSAVKITMDAEVLTDRLDGMAIAIDPGAHSFLFETPGRPPVRRQYVIRQGQKNRLELIAFPSGTPPLASMPGGAIPGTLGSTRSARAASASASASTSTSVPGYGSAADPGTSTRPSPSPEVSAFSGTRKTVAIVAATLGVVGIGTGAFFGWQALSRRDDAQNVCPNLCRDQEAVEMWQDARRSGNLSTGAFIVGGVGLATATLLWLTANPETAAAPAVQVGPGAASLGIGGQW